MGAMAASANQASWGVKRERNVLTAQMRRSTPPMA